MKRLLAMLFVAFPLPVALALAGETRFRSYVLVVDPGEAPLAAWQVELAYDPVVVRIVGVEGGRDPWQEAPYYDPKGLEAGRLPLAAFTLAADPPARAARVARIHVQETGWGETSIRTKLTAAADPDGRRIGATVRLIPEEGDRP